MYSKTPTGKATKGSVKNIVSNGRLQLRFRFAGKRHYISYQYRVFSGHWFRLMGYIVRNAHSASIAAILDINRQNPYSEGISSIFPITRNQCQSNDSATFNFRY